MIQVRRANPPEAELRRYTGKKRKLLLDYADWTVEVLNKPEVRGFVDTIQLREGISPDTLRDVRVMVLPPRYRVRGVLHGSLRLEQGRVSIYPAILQRGRFKSAPDRITKSWEETIADPRTRKELEQAVTETLFHEVLHLKYPNGERTVRRLAAEYSKEYSSLLQQSGRD